MFICLRSYPGESTRSHLNSEVKHLWARLVEWWVTTFESLVLKTFIIVVTFFFFYLLNFKKNDEKKFESVCVWAKQEKKKKMLDK